MCQTWQVQVLVQVHEEVIQSTILRTIGSWQTWRWLIMHDVNELGADGVCSLE